MVGFSPHMKTNTHKMVILLSALALAGAFSVSVSAQNEKIGPVQSREVLAQFDVGGNGKLDTAELARFEGADDKKKGPKKKPIK